jgi:hypothetical protein
LSADPGFSAVISGRQAMIIDASERVFGLTPATVPAGRS